MSKATASRVSHLPPTSALFAAFLGYNPVRTLLGGALTHLGSAKAAYLTGRSFFPGLISPPFMTGLRVAFDFAAAACAVAGVASWFRGGKYHHADEPEVTLTMGAGAADYAPATTSAETAGARTGVSGG